MGNFSNWFKKLFITEDKSNQNEVKNPNLANHLDVENKKELEKEPAPKEELSNLESEFSKINQEESSNQKEEDSYKTTTWVGNHEVTEKTNNEIKAAEIKLKDEITSEQKLANDSTQNDEDLDDDLEKQIDKIQKDLNYNDDSESSDSTVEFKNLYNENDTSDIPSFQTAELNYDFDDVEDDEATSEQEINHQENIETKQRAILIKPSHSKEAKIIAKRLMENNIVVLNLERVSEIDFERIKDFVSGTLYSLNGNYRKVNALIAVLLPTKKVDEDYLQLVLEKANKM